MENGEKLSGGKDSGKWSERTERDGDTSGEEERKEKSDRLKFHFSTTRPSS